MLDERLVDRLVAGSLAGDQIEQRGVGVKSERRPGVVQSATTEEGRGRRPELSVTICVLTTDPTQAPLFRLPVEPDALNGLDRPSSLMADKLTTVPRTSLGEQIGRLADEDVIRLDRAIVVFLGLG